jgi:hypothetical protein
MMDLQTIHNLTAKSARDAKRRGKQPAVFSEDQLEKMKASDFVPEEIRQMPNLGSYLPKGWARVRLVDQPGMYAGDNKGFGAFMVDGSGFGQPGEPALTVVEFLDKLKPGLGYGIVEAGQFQVKIGVYARRTDQ